MTLETYYKKRDFTRTPEPAGRDDAPDLAGNRFVVQEHHASHLHYDFRLEIDGVLVSWAVPKGPPTAYGVRRLAMKTEDHPVSYIDFHGTIAHGNYGAGEVGIWDSGTFVSVGTEPIADGVRHGKLEVQLSGDRLQGKYDLVRIDDDKDQWLLLKSRGDSPKRAAAAATAAQTFTAVGAPSAPMPVPGSIAPMLAVSVAKPFNDPDWHFEIKWDGYRALLTADSSGESLMSRNRVPLSGTFPELQNLREWLACDSAVVDGEITAMMPDGRPQFQALQHRIGRAGAGVAAGEAAIVYIVFDILHCDGRDLRALPLATRREILARVVRPGGPIRFSDHIVGDGVALFERLSALGMEGMVAKRADSPYLSRRSDFWAKVKTRRTVDVVIAGYTESQSTARPFGSLLIGLYAGQSLISAGHVGTGFNAATMQMLKRSLDALATPECAFGLRPHTNGPAHWVRPELVCEVSYAEMTDDGALRHPVFLQLRSDKTAKECQVTGSVVEQAASSKTANAPNRNASARHAALGELTSALAKGASPDSAQPVVSGRRVALTHLGKVYWPRTDTRKRDLLRYYFEVSDTLLPHLADRPLMVQRFPNGVEGKSFFQHDTGSSLPDTTRTYEIEEHGHPVRYALCDDLATLLSLVNLGAIPLHLWNARASTPGAPDRIVFDLDPAGPISSAVYVAHALRAVLREIGLESYPKTSGASGLHIYVPIEPHYRVEDVVAFARLIGESVVQRMPDAVTLERRIKNRGEGRVYLDCVQNGPGKTVVAPYSVRPEPTPTVSTPLLWDEVTVDLNPAHFTIETVLERILYRGDLFKPVLDKPQRLGVAPHRTDTDGGAGAVVSTDASKKVVSG